MRSTLRTIGAAAGVMTMCLSTTGVATASASVALNHPGWTVTDTGLAGSVNATIGETAVQGTPPGVALVDGGAEGQPLTALLPDGSTRSLGAVNPVVWLGDGTPQRPVVLVVTRFESTAGSDLNGDGDVLDSIAAVSVDYGTPVDAFTFTSGSTRACKYRVSIELAVVCNPERASGRDLNTDGDLNDMQLMYIHGDGSVEATSMFVAEVVSSIPTGVLLPNGTLAIESYRIGPDGSVTAPRVPNSTVLGMVGTAEVGHDRTTGKLQITPLNGVLVKFTLGVTVYHVGNAIWIQEYDPGGTVGRGLCRVREDATLACMQIAILSGGSVVPIGDDSAMIWDAYRLGSRGPSLEMLVPAGGMPIELDAYAPRTFLALGDGSGLISTAGFGSDPSKPQLFHVFSDGRVVEVPLPGGEPFDPTSLGDGRAMFQMNESTDDLNGDGNVDDVVSGIFADGHIVNLGVLAVSDANPTRPTPLALSPGGPILLAIDEYSSPDLNGDGDRLDSVASVFDDGVLTSLGVGMSNAGDVEFWTLTLMRLVGPDHAMITGFEQSAPGVFRTTVYSVTGPAYVPTVLADPPPVIAVQPPAAPPAAPLGESSPAVRLLDTRADGPQTGYHGAQPSAGQTIAVQAPAGATAVALNITGLNAAQSGFVTVYPCGQPLPTVSNLNLTPGLVSSNLVVSAVGAGGAVCIFTQRSADLIADLASTAIGPEFHAIGPARLVDTRRETQTGYIGHKPVDGQVLEVMVPASGSAVLNVTGVDVSETGFVTVYPCDSPRPTTSNLNLTPGVISANSVFVKVGQRGTVCIFTQRSANLIVDIAGTLADNASFSGMVPVRVLDTRESSRVAYTGPMPVAGDTVELAVPAGARAAALNVTGMDTTETGFITVYPCGTTRPLASNLNLTPGRITPNMVITPVGSGDRVCVFTQRSANLVVDLIGLFAA
jgi:hypothetical protein